MLYLTCQSDTCQPKSVTLTYHLVMRFSEVLKELRTERKMTQKQLADKLNLSEYAVRFWETRGQEPSLFTVCEIAKIFNVTVGQLLGVEEY